MSIRRQKTTVRPGGMAARPAATSSMQVAPPPPPRVKKTYDNIQQGIEELYPNDKNVKLDIDIVFVPGLGAHPRESWNSAKGDFNWATHQDGIVKDFPKARVLLYHYESSWVGGLKVKQFMHNIANGLLHGLQTKREACKTRPLVFIGHSMGGLVIAKSVIYADTRRDQFPAMFEPIAGCIFFGTPFGGAQTAAAAAMFSVLTDSAVNSKLLELMRPEDESLRELKNDFLRLAGKMSPKIELFCFWEEQQTDFAKMAGMPFLSGIAKKLIPDKLADFVDRNSASLPGVNELGLAKDHRNLVKFDSFKDLKYQQIRDPIKKVMVGAHLAVKNRLNSTRDIDRGMINSLMEVLDGARVERKRRELAQDFVPSSWVPKESDFITWVTKPEKDKKRGDCLWIRGSEGRGKTSATIAALSEIERIVNVEAINTDQGPVLLAYFFCDNYPDYSTAEDLLKSLILQLIKKQEMLAWYGKNLRKKGASAESSVKTQANLTVENLWQILQDMLGDEFIGSSVYFVINNLHILSDISDSTATLMNLIKDELLNMNNPHQRRTPVRWMFTSRETHLISQALKIEDTRLIDLEDEKYGNQIQLELQKHAQKKVEVLGVDKEYNKALQYFASSLIGKRAQNTQWIDITCVQLQLIPKAADKKARSENDRRVRRVLEGLPQNLKMLLDRAWIQVFKALDDDVEKIKEMLRVLVLTYDDPTESELCLLADIFTTTQDIDRPDITELGRLVEMCKPLLKISGGKVCFLIDIVKTHLLENAKSLLGLSEEETRWQHGVLAYRSFEHIMTIFEYEIAEEAAEESEDGEEDEEENEDDEVATQADNEEHVEVNETENIATETNKENEGGEHEEEEESDDEESDEDDDESMFDTDAPLEDAEAEAARGKALDYAIKYWLKHASEATLNIAEVLSLETEFWKSDSQIRRRWLYEYYYLTNDFDSLNHQSLTAMHVAASIGFRELVTALLRNGYQSELNERDVLANSPLHLAAYFGNEEIVEELLNRGAAIDDAIEVHKCTPLHMAAFNGHVNVMKKLIQRGADFNAIANGTGPVVNAAITSGNREAVKYLVERNATLSVPKEERQRIKSEVEKLKADEDEKKSNENENEDEDEQENENDDEAGNEEESEEEEADDFSAPLALAATYTDVSMFEYLIENYADKLQPEDYSEALIDAAAAGKIDVFKTLVSYHHKQEFLEEAIDGAAREGNWTIVTLMLETFQLNCNGAFKQAATSTEDQESILEAIWEHTNGNISAETLNDSLYNATDCEKIDTVRLILEKFGGDPNTATGTDYGNALTAAAFDGTIDIIKLLLEHGADVNSPEGWAIQSAASQGHIDVVNLLLDKGADINANTYSEHFEYGTALQAACQTGNAEVTKLLLDRGADPNLRSREHLNPLVTAVCKGEAEITELMLKAGADVNVFGQDCFWINESSSPLIFGAYNLPKASVQLLLDYGAEINLPDQDGDTALIVAARRGEEEVLRFLLENGADIMHFNNEGDNALKCAHDKNNDGVLSILLQQINIIMKALTKAIDSGNEEVSNVLKSCEDELKESAKVPPEELEEENVEGNDEDQGENDENKESGLEAGNDPGSICPTPTIMKQQGGLEDVPLVPSLDNAEPVALDTAESDNQHQQTSRQDSQQISNNSRVFSFEPENQNGYQPMATPIATEPHAQKLENMVGYVALGSHGQRPSRYSPNNSPKPPSPPQAQGLGIGKAPTPPRKPQELMGTPPPATQYDNGYTAYSPYGRTDTGMADTPQYAADQRINSTESAPSVPKRKPAPAATAYGRPSPPTTQYQPQTQYGHTQSYSIQGTQSPAYNQPTHYQSPSLPAQDWSQHQQQASSYHRPSDQSQYHGASSMTATMPASPPQQGYNWNGSGNNSSPQPQLQQMGHSNNNNSETWQSPRPDNSKRPSNSSFFGMKGFADKAKTMLQDMK